jgi:hypothetical protein
MLQLELPFDLETRLDQEAQRRGLTREAVLIQLLDERLPPVMTDARRTAALAKLEQWAKEDTELSAEAATENKGVLRKIDDNRPSHRKLFTDILEDAPQ